MSLKKEFAQLVKEANDKLNKELQVKEITEQQNLNNLLHRQHMLMSLLGGRPKKSESYISK